MKLWPAMLLGLLSRPLAAQQTHRHPHAIVDEATYACRSLRDAHHTDDLAGQKYAYDEVMALTRSGRCVLLQAGTVVTVMPETLEDSVAVPRVRVRLANGTLMWVAEIMLR